MSSITTHIQHHHSGKHPFVQHAAFFVYTIACLVVVFHHEPWRDEAQAWLIARDLSLVGIINQMQYETSPALWHFLLVPLAKSGLPFISQQIVAAGMVIVAVATLIYRSPFSLWQMLAVMFSSYIAFEYAVVSRSYSLSVMLLFLIATLDSNRHARPVVYSILVVLLANTNVHSLVISTALTVTYYLGTNGTAKFKSCWHAGIIMTAGIVASFLQMPNVFIDYLTKLKQIVVGGQSFDQIETMMEAFTHAIFPTQSIYPPFAMLLVLVISLAVVWRVRRNFRALLILLFTIGAWSFSSMAELMAHADRHRGFILLIILLVIWINETDQFSRPKKPSSSDHANQENVVQDIRGWVRRTPGGISGVVMGLMFAATVPTGIALWWQDLEGKFSTSRDMAEFIKAHNASEPIAAYPGPHASSLLPYIPEARFWYMGPQRQGTFMVWDETYDENKEKRARKIIKRDIDSGNVKPWVLVTNRIGNAKPLGLKLVHQTTDLGANSRGGETFYLYQLRPNKK